MNEQEIAGLVNETLSGNPKAFESLYNDTCKSVWFLCYNFLKNEQDAMDIMQDTYLTAYKNLGTLINPSSFNSWIMQMSVNKCRNYIKRNRQIPTEDEMIEQYLAEENEFFLPEEYAADSERRSTVMGIMQNYLSDVQYQTVLMYYFSNMSISEIANEMECPEGTVKYRLSVSRGKIKQGVMQYEQINDTKLYSFAGVPLLAVLLAEEAKVYYLDPIVGNSIMSAVYEMTVADITSAAGAQAVVATGKTAGGIWAGLGAKIAVAIAAVAIIGGVVAAIVIKNNKDEKSNSSQVTENSESDVSEKNDNNSGDISYSGGVITNDNKAAYTEDMCGYIDDNGNYVNDYFGFTTYYAGQGWDFQLCEEYYYNLYGVQKTFLEAIEDEAPRVLWAQHWDDGAMDRGDMYFDCYDLLHNMDEVETTEEWYNNYMLDTLSKYREQNTGYKYSLYSALIDGIPCYYIESEITVSTSGESSYGAPHHLGMIYVFKDNMYIKIDVCPSYCSYNYEEVFGNQLKLFNMSDFVPIDIDDVEKQNEVDKLTGSDGEPDISADNEG